MPHAGTLLAHLHHFTAPAASDAALLTRWLIERDEAAFAALVARHGPMVLGVCRRVLSDAQHAEDVFQATFLVLARKASQLRRPEALPSFLYGVALRLARKAQAAARHRPCVSLNPDAPEPIDPAPHPLDILSGRELLALLDTEVARLPERFRLPLLLCLLEGRTVEEAARQLGWSVGSLRGRLARAREKLRRRLSRRGLDLSVGAVALLAPVVVPERLLAASIRQLTCPVSPAIRALAGSALPGLKWKMLSVGLFVLATVGLGAGLPLLHAPQPQPPAASPVALQVQAKEEPRRDRQGDPLPPGAVARLGTLRFRIDCDRVDQMDYSPDGKTLAAASTRGLWLFDAQSGKTLRIIRPADTWFYRVVISPDGKRLLTSGTRQDQHGPATTVAQIWNVADGQKADEVKLENICALGWSPERQPLVATLQKGEILLHEIAAGKTRRFAPKNLPDAFQINGFLGGPLGNFHCVLGKSLLAAGDEKGAIHVWDRTSGKKRHVFKTPGDLTGGLFVNSLALSPDERWLASMSHDGANMITVVLWDVTTGKSTHTVAADQQYLHGLAFSPNSKTLATIGWREVRFHDVTNGRERSRTKNAGSMIAAAVAFTPDSKTLATAEMYCGALHRWDTATGEPRPQPEGHSSHWLGTAAFSPDGRRVATSGGMDGTLRIWETTTGRMLTQVRRSPRSLIACAFAADGQTLFACWDDKLIVTDAATGRELHGEKPGDRDKQNTYRGYDGMHLTDDRRQLIVFGQSTDAQRKADYALTGWDTVTRQQLFHRRRESRTHGTAVSPDAKLLATAQAGAGGKGELLGGGPMQLEDLITGAKVLTFPPFAGQRWPLLFSPDGRLLISYNNAISARGSESSLRVWEVRTASELLTLPTTDGNAKVAFTPDSRLLAAPAPDGTILLWDLSRGKELHRLRDFGSTVTSLSFSPDGRRLVSGLSDSTLLVWDVPPREKSQGKLTAEDAAKAWNDLAGRDAPLAFRARWTLADAPEPALELLSKHLQRAQPADAKQLRRLLTDLESEQFAVREKAQAELEALGELAEPALRKALEDKPTLEMRRRVQAVLERLRAPVTQPESLRSLRAMAVLEDIGTPEARRLLEELAQGAPEARVTREAKAALNRRTLQAGTR